VKLNCPSCGAQIDFVNAAVILSTCSYCRALVVRQDMNLEAIGISAELHQEATILQLQTLGKDRQGKFVLTGRIQKQWERGYWSEWVASYADGKFAWLSEAQGFFALMVPVQSPKIAFASLSVEQSVVIAGQTFVVSDIKTSTIIAIEGQLPFKTRMGEIVHSVDLQADASTFASIEYDSSANITACVGRLFEAEELHLEHLRHLEGW
jgi:hypothetical protein